MQLVIYPEPILQKRAPALKLIDDSVRERVQAMFQLMYRENGVGLAAPQVGWSARLFVLNPLGAESPEGEMVFINPRVVEADGEDIDEEGCLSIPEVRGNVERNESVSFECQDLSGELVRRELEGLAARVAQHEYDHLDGILFIKRLSPAEWLKVKTAVKRLEKEYRKKQQEGARR
ncbi:MAG: peptide deformylase [Planctomycetota bacterium]|nr:peptide deformylase [Planctomycetota bacterium]